jgi:predicted permease
VGVLTTVLPVVVMIALGALARRTKLVVREGIGALQILVMKVTLPAVLLGAFYRAGYTLNVVVIVALMFGCSLAAWALGALAQKKLAGASKYLPFLTTGFEAGMMGYALYAMLFGQESIRSFAVMDLGQVLFVFTFYMAFLGAQEGDGKAMGARLMELVKSPTIVAIAAGELLGATGLGAKLYASPLGEPVQAAIDFAAKPTGAVILFVIGYELDFSGLKWREVGQTLGIRIVVTTALLALMIGALKLMEPDNALLMWAAALMFTLPPPYVLPIVSKDESAKGYITSVLSVATVYSLIVFAVMAAMIK